MARASGGSVEAAPTGEPASVESLAREALGHEPEAVRRFLRAVSPAILRACRAVIGRQHPDVEDAVQDCFIDVMRGLPGFRFEGNLLGYVSKIAVRRALVWRKRTVTRGRHLQLLGDLGDDLPFTDASVAEMERAEVVRDLIRRLRPDQAETLVMRVVLGLSIEEIAQSTEVSVNTVKTRLRLGKDSLRRSLVEHARRERGMADR